MERNAWRVIVALVLAGGMYGGATLSAELVPHHGELVKAHGELEECICCHDGKIAKVVHFCTGDCGFNSPHQVAKRYPPPGRERTYRPIGELQAMGIELANGEITCISCHNLRNSGRYHLVMDNRGSRLCLACHLM